MDALETKKLIRKFIGQKLAKKNGQTVVKDEEDIISAGIIDSLGIMQLVEYIEETFSIVIKDEDIIPENFESVDSITSFIRETQ